MTNLDMAKDKAAEMFQRTIVRIENGDMAALEAALSTIAALDKFQEMNETEAAIWLARFDDKRIGIMTGISRKELCRDVCGHEDQCQ